MMPDDARFRKGNTWGNWLGSVNWNHLLPSNVMLNNTLSFTHYRLKDVMTLKPSDTDIEAGMQDIRRKTRSALQDVSLRSDATYAFRKNWDLDFGMKLTYLHFRPMKFTNNIPGMGNHDEYANAFEPAVYVSNKIKPLKWLDAEVGLRGVGYFNGSMTNFSVEPRLNVNLFLHENHIFNLSAMRVSQNAQMIQNVGSLTANEIYVPSGKDIPVSYSNQFSVGYQTFFDDKNYQLEIDAYYKTLSHLTTYKDGYGYAMGDIFWREKLETGGTGLAHGLEFLFKKNKGKFTGFLSYTYSKSTRQYAGINRGETYDFEYDSPHDIAVSLGYQLSDKWSFGATWQYQTGLPYTPAIGRHIALDEAGSPYEVLIYGDKNSARMGAYHRLDIAFKKKTYTKKRRREGDMLIKTSNRRAEWTFGIHNVYNRQNPYFYYYAQSQYGEMFLGPDVPLKQYQIAMFPFIPMISFKFWFGDGSKEW
jgi:hypothetical protein